MSDIKKIKLGENVYNLRDAGALRQTGNQVLDGSLVTTGSLTVQDNFIGINGNGSTLDTVGKAGIIAVTGDTNNILKDGNYKIDPDKFATAINLKLINYADAPLDGLPEAPWKDHYGPYILSWDQSKVDKFASLNLTDTSSNRFYVMHDPMNVSVYQGNFQYIWYNMGAITEGTSGSLSVNLTALDPIITFKNQIIPENSIDFVCSFLLKENGSSVTSADFITKGAAYASPIYDTNANSLKIGLGNYEKDNEGNVTNFEFGAGQGQSLTTRDDTIKNNSVVKWDSVSNKLKEAPISAHNNYVRVNGDLKADSLTIQDNIVAINGSGSANNKVGLIMADGLETDLLKVGPYTLDSKLLFEAMGYCFDGTGAGYFKTASAVLSALRALHPATVDVSGDFIEFKWDIDGLFNDPNIDGEYFRFFNFTLTVQYDTTIKTLISLRNDGSGEAPIIETTNVGIEFPFNNQEISSEHFDVYKQFIRYGTEDGELLSYSHLDRGNHTAYAAPIYDPQLNTLRIGQGTFSRDDNGNIKSFDFIAGESQAVATRSDDLVSDNLVKWDGLTSKLIDTGIYTYCNNTTNAALIGSMTKDLSKEWWIDVNSGLQVMPGDGSITAYQPGKIYHVGKDLANAINLLLPTKADNNIFVDETETLATREWIEKRLASEENGLEGALSQIMSKYILSNGIDVQDTDEEGSGVAFIHGSSISLKDISNDTGTRYQRDKITTFEWNNEAKTVDLSFPKESGILATQEWVDPQLVKNLKDGEGKFSIQSSSTQNYDGSAYDTDIKKIEATGHESFAFGRGCKATGTRSFAFGTYNISAGNTSFVTGQENTATGSASFVAGRKNNLSIINTHAIGQGLISNRENGIALGQYNKGINDAIFEVGYGTSESDRKNALHINANNGNVYIDRNVLLGKNSVAESKKNVISIGDNNYHGAGTTLAVGDNNRITHDFENANSVAIGSSNKITSTSALAVGYNNSVNGYTAVALGTGLETSDTQGQVVVGTYNTANSAARFIVGNGDSSIRKTAFEVLIDGRVKAYGVPSEPNDVIRKVDIQDGSLLNIKNGEGICSLVQNYTTDLDPDLETYSNKATAPLAIALGEGCRATGPAAVSMGIQSISSGTASFSLGQKIESAASGALGTGYSNKIGSNAHYSFVANSYNETQHTNTIVGGIHNKSIADNEVVLGSWSYEGLHLVSPNEELITYTNGKGVSKLRIGAGSENDRKNLLEITDKYLAYDGSVKINGRVYAKGFYGSTLKINSNNCAIDSSQGNITVEGTVTSRFLTVTNRLDTTNGQCFVAGPTEDQHAVNKKYLDDKLVNLLKLIDGLTEEQLTALNKFAKSLTIEE